MRGRIAWSLTVLAALGLLGCGEAQDSSTGTKDAQQTSAPTAASDQAPENSLAAAVDDLKEKGFTGVKAEGFTEKGITALGSVEASKSGASFYAAEFATPTEAEQVGIAFQRLDEKGGLPFEVSGTTLIYTTKCCTDRGPKPVIPDQDFEDFKTAIGQ